jgi:hypothetical protein
MLLPQRACQSPVLQLSRWAIVVLVFLHFTPAEAQVTANPSELAFGDVQIGTKSALPLTLTNNGTSVVTITAGQISGPGFGVETKLPIVLNPGQQFPLNVFFAPRIDGSYSATISGSNSSGPIVNLPVTGSGTQAGFSVGLAWNPSPAPPAIIGYNVYRGIQNGGPYSKLNAKLDPQTAYTDYTVMANQTYYYVTTSVDSNGQESAYSNQTEANIP